MPPTGQIHRDVALENISIAYRPAGAIAQELAPVYPVVRDSDVYYVYARDNFRIPETLVSNKGEPNRSDWNVSTSSYILTRHALYDYISDDDRSNADKAIRLDVDLTEHLTDQMMLRYEKDLAQLCQDPGNWSNNTSLTSTLAWSANTTTSNPITQIDSATSIIIQQSGKRPNVLVIDDQTFRAAKEHVSITDRVKYTSADSVTEAMLGKLFNVERVLVPSITENSGEEGLADSMAFIWTNAAWLAYVDRSPGLKKVSALYTFRKNMGGSIASVSRWREEIRTSDAIKVEMKYQHRAVATACAYLIRDTF
jgi:hypothetical protein